MHPHRFVPFIIFDGYLRFGVGTQIRSHLPFAQIGHCRSLPADNGQLGKQQVRQIERQRHIIIRLIASIPEHHTLISRPLTHRFGALHAPIDIGRLLVYGRKNTARVGIELIRTFIISDTVNHSAGNLHQIDISIRFNLACQYDLTGRYKGFACNFRVRVIRQKLVEQSVRYLVGHFIGVSFRHRFRGKQIIHWFLS